MTGVAVLVDGAIVAWFESFGEEEEYYCTSRWFGRWLTWKATAPSIIPLTEEEEKELNAKVEELTAKIQGCIVEPKVADD
jgi:hypothetical protein